MAQHGGKRPGSGRKPSLATKLKREVIEAKGAEAEYALALFVSIMRDTRTPQDTRMVAAREVMDRVWGKPKQAVEHSGPDGGPIEYQDAKARLLGKFAKDAAESGEAEST